MIDMLNDDAFVKLIWIGSVLFVILLAMIIMDMVLEHLRDRDYKNEETGVYIFRDDVYNQEEDPKA